MVLTRTRGVIADHGVPFGLGTAIVVIIGGVVVESALSTPGGRHHAPPQQAVAAPSARPAPEAVRGTPAPRHSTVVVPVAARAPAAQSPRPNSPGAKPSSGGAARPKPTPTSRPRPTPTPTQTPQCTLKIELLRLVKVCV